MSLVGTPKREISSTAPKRHTSAARHPFLIQFPNRQKLHWTISTIKIGPYHWNDNRSWCQILKWSMYDQGQRVELFIWMKAEESFNGTSCYGEKVILPVNCFYSLWWFGLANDSVISLWPGNGLRTRHRMNWRQRPLYRKWFIQLYMWVSIKRDLVVFT